MQLQHKHNLQTMDIHLLDTIAKREGDLLISRTYKSIHSMDIPFLDTTAKYSSDHLLRPRNKYTNSMKIRLFGTIATRASDHILQHQSTLFEGADNHFVDTIALHSSGHGVSLPKWYWGHPMDNHSCVNIATQIHYRVTPRSDKDTVVLIPLIDSAGFRPSKFLRVLLW